MVTLKYDDYVSPNNESYLKTVDGMKRVDEKMSRKKKKLATLKI